MAVRIVTDSTADIPAALLEGLDITVVPLNVHFGEKTYRDGVDLSSDQFFKLLVESHVLPTTSQPSAGLFQETYERLSADADGIVSIHLSSKLSGTLESALLGKASSSGKGWIEIIDTQQTSMGLGLTVLAAARLAKNGGDIESILAMIEKRRERTHLLFFVDTLEYLQKGGRIGKASALLGTLLNLKPILKLVNGEVHAFERIRTRGKAVEKLVSLIESYPHIEELAILHSTCLQDAQNLAERLDKTFPKEKAIIGSVGPVVGTHVGPGILGFVVYEG